MLLLCAWIALSPCACSAGDGPAPLSHPKKKKKPREEICHTASSVVFPPGHIPGLASPPPRCGMSLLLGFIPGCCTPKRSCRLQEGGGHTTGTLLGIPGPNVSPPPTPVPHLVPRRGGGWSRQRGPSSPPRRGPTWTHVKIHHQILSRGRMGVISRWVNCQVN